MTDESKTKRDSELVLDWDDAVDSWEQELDKSAMAEAAPFPAHGEAKTSRPPAIADKAIVDKSTLPPLTFSLPALNSSRAPQSSRASTTPPEGSSLPPAPSDTRATSAPPAFPQGPRNPRAETARTESGRPRMYRPPSGAEELQELADISNRTLPPPAGGSSWMDDEDDEGDNTRIAAIPRELIEALARADAADRGVLSRGDGRLPGLSAPRSGFEPNSVFPTEHAESDAGSLSLDTDDAFSLRTSMPAPADIAKQAPVSDAPQIEIGGAGDIDFDTDDLDDEGLDDDLASDDALDDENAIEDEPTVMRRSAAPKSLNPEDLRSVKPLPAPFFALPKPPMAPPKRPPEQKKPREEPSVLRNLDELAPPSEHPPESAPAEPALVVPVLAPVVVQVRKDDTTLLALRKIRVQKRRQDVLPLCAAGEAGKRGRISLLEALAAEHPGADAADLLVAAAELAEEANDPELARDLFERALVQLPGLFSAFHGLGRLALATGDTAAYLQILERSANQAYSALDKARALSALARVRWLVQRDFPAALRAAAEAERLRPDEPGYVHLLSRIEAAANPAAADVTLIRLATESTDPEMACLWWVAAGRALETRGDLAGADNCYARAAERKPHSLEAQLSRARTRLASAQRGAAAEALSAVVDSLPGGPAREAVARRAAVLHGSTDPARAALLLADSLDPLSARTAAELSLEQPDLALRERVARRWTEVGFGLERSLSQLLLAELRAAAADFGDCESALSAALESDPTFSLVPVVRELLARRHGGALIRTTTETQDGLQAAAQFGRNASQLSHELDALLRARAEHVSPECTELLLLDAALEVGDERARPALRSEAERGIADERVSALLTLADYERRSGNLEQAREALLSASELDARNALVVRALVRAPIPDEQKARVLRREAESTSGTRSAFLLLRAARALGPTPARLETAGAAYDAAPAYVPAMWALHQEARRQGDIERLSDLHAREAGRAKDSHEAVAHLVRAALVRAGADADAAAAQLTRALDLMPSDPVLRELVIRLGDAVPATLRAEAIQSSAERAPPSLKRPATLAAAAAFEDANQPARALALFEAVLRDQPTDPIAAMGVTRVARAAGKATQVDAERRRQLQEATDPRAEREALEALLELGSAGDPEEQLGFANRLLALEPHHAGALRKLERRAMDSADLEALASVEMRMVAASPGPKDRLARLRLLSLLSMLQGPEKLSPEQLDDLFIQAGMQASRGLWLGRQLMASGASRGNVDVMRKATELTLTSVTDGAEQSTLGVQRARLLLPTGAAEAAQFLEATRELTPQHPTLLETLAEARLLSESLDEAVELLGQGARQAQTKSRAARLHYQAGLVLEERLGSPERAKDAFRRAAEANVEFKDVQERLERLLAGRNDLEGLVALAEARLQAARTPAARVELSRKLAQLYDQQGELEKALDALRAALELAPEDLPLLSQIATLLERASNQRERAEILVRVARLSRDPEELCSVFFKLGEIYDEHLPDPRRAEAAYRRVIKLSPKHQAALERLSALLKRSGQTELAAEALERLMQVVERPERKREVALELAKLKEDAGDFRGAEEVLERLRKGSPTDPVVLRELADFYRRRQAQSALAMHLNRAANDLRHSLSADPNNPGVWSALVDVLEDKGRKDPAGAAASGAFALGLGDARLARLVDSEGSIPGLGTAAFSELLDDLVFTDLMPPAVRILFRHGADAMNRAAPVDLKHLAAEKLERKHPLRAVANEFGKLAGLGDAEVFVTSQLPFAFVPVSEAPFQLLVGRTILSSLSNLEQRFLVARACKIARAQMSITCRVRPEELAALLGGLIALQVPDYRLQGVESAMLDEMARRMGKHLSKRAREDMLPHAVELAGQPELDLTRSYLLASTAGNRAALLATGSVPAGLSSLTKLGGLVADGRPKVAAVAEIEEARELLTFCISESHFEARQRGSAERR